MLKLQPRPDFGVRSLLPEWRQLFVRKHLGADVAAGLTVACVAIPLSLAIALASGVAPGVGLVTAVVGGLACALFGGTALQVSGPAAAMAVLVAAIVQEHGMGALLVVSAGCGLLQLATGALGLGRFVRLVPMPVIEGFTAGIGAIILVGQLPRALGLPPPPQSAVLDVVTHLADFVHRTKPGAVAVNLIALAVLYGLPRLTRRVPPHLVAVAAATLAAVGLGLDAPALGDIPRSLPSPRLPDMPSGAALGPIAASTLVVFALASLETLLSSAAVEKMAPGSRNDPDQELIGQGVGNVASALFGGIPVTGVIARSGTNVQAGAKTRRASIVHALALVASVYALAPLLGRIPIAALAAVLFSVAARMLSPKTFLRLWRHSRADGAVFAVTFVTIVFVDLLEGVQWGVVAALAIGMARYGRARMSARAHRMGDHYVFTFEGPLTFLSSLDVDAVRGELDLLDEGRAAVFDLREVKALDASGAEMLVGLVEHARTRGLRPLVAGLDGDARARFRAVAGELADEVIVPGERALAEALQHADGTDARLQTGVARYRATQRPRYAALFERLAGGQRPHTLFITCSDSRITPSLITATEPGELFIVRDVGNVVAPGHVVQPSAVGAAVDYAVGVLRVSKVVVCGHSRCGAMHALRSDDPIPPSLRNLSAWIEKTEVRERLRGLPASLDVDAVSRLNALLQLDHLRTYPVVAERLAAGDLSLGAWFFDVATGDVEEWSDAAKRWVPIGATPAPSHDRAARPQAHA